MEKDILLNMEPYMLLSWINTKLRDEFGSFHGLCEEYAINNEAIEDRLKTIGYCYNEEHNQFKMFCN